MHLSLFFPAFIEMKISETLTYVFQYANYRMTEWDDKLWRGMSKSWMIPSDMKVVFLFGLVEMGIALALYKLIYHAAIERPIYIPSNPILLVVLSAFGLAITLLNQSTLGPKSRIEHYRTIFKAWDKRRMLRWNLYLFLITVLAWITWIYAIWKI